MAHRIGPAPEAPKPLLDRATPVYQARMKARMERLIDALHQIDPPGDRAPYATKYNAKVDACAFLLKNPGGAIMAVHDDMLPDAQLGTLADWRVVAAKLRDYLREQEEETMDAQLASSKYNELHRLMKENAPQ